jgi:CheY-like chemotaxis protein
VIHLEPAAETAAVVHNLSMGGCGVYCEHKLPTGKALELSFGLMDESHPENVQATVRSVLKSGDGFDIGFQFVDAAETFLSDLEFVIAARLGNTRESAPEARRVVLFEQDLAVQKRLRKCLEEAGFKVTATRSLVDTFHLVRSWAPEAVVVSAAVSELPGADVCRILRGTRGCERLPTVLVLGEGGSEAVGTVSNEHGATACCPAHENIAKVVQKALWSIPRPAQR